MNKREFLSKMKDGLSGLPGDGVAEQLEFYSEMIDDRMDDGFTEEQAVADIGPVDAVIARILQEMPLTKLVKEKIRPVRKGGTTQTVLLVLGAPLWLPLLIAAGAVLFSVYAALWAVILSLWSAEAAFAAGALAGAAAGILSVCRGEVLRSALFFGAGLVLAGLSVFLFDICRKVTKGILALTGKITLGLKYMLMGKEKTK